MQHGGRIAEERTLMFQKQFLYSPFFKSAQKTMISAPKTWKKIKTKNNTKRAKGAFNQELWAKLKFHFLGIELIFPRRKLLEKCIYREGLSGPQKRSAFFFK